MVGILLIIFNVFDILLIIFVIVFVIIFVIVFVIILIVIVNITTVAIHINITDMGNADRCKMRRIIRRNRRR